MSRFPIETTGFVGRRQELARVRKLLSIARIVTLTGIGGVGKSRLALRVARTVQATFPDGVRVVDLAAVRESSTLPHALVNALDLPAQAVRDPESVLVEYLATKRILLVLDNCEHLLERCAQLVTAVLRATRATRILATSREPLRVVGEHIWQVPPLPVPVTGGCTHRQDGQDALDLFETRAATVRPGFALTADNERVVTRLCQRLDGLPLAIELAAVRMRTSSLDRILSHLEDRYRSLTDSPHSELPRHQTMRAALEWSYDLCTPSERLLWARASVFAGGFDRDAAETVCAGDGLPATEVMPAVAGLVDKSILTRQEHGMTTRYSMLETIRQYGQQRITDSAERTRLRRRHRDCYRVLAEQAEANSFGPRQLEWFDRLRADDANLWTALEFSMSEPGENSAALHMTGALWVYWIACGLIRDGRYWLRRALDTDGCPNLARAKALWVEAWCASLQGDSDSALASLTECRRLASELGDEQTLTRVLQFSGTAHLVRNDVDHALELQDATLERYRQWGELSSPAMIAFVQRADAACMRGDTALAHALCDECTRSAAARGEKWSLSWAQWIRGMTWWVEGNMCNATVELRTGLRTKIALHDLLGIPFCVELLAWVSAEAGFPEDGAVLLGIAANMWEPIGKPLFGYARLLTWHEQCVDQARRELGDRAYEAARRRGARLSFDQAMSHALGDTAAPRGPLDPESILSSETKREHDIAELVAGGLSNQDIANRLMISQRTTERHIEHLFQKLSLTSRAQLATWFMQHRRG